MQINRFVEVILLSKLYFMMDIFIMMWRGIETFSFNSNDLHIYGIEHSKNTEGKKHFNEKNLTKCLFLTHMGATIK